MRINAADRNIDIFHPERPCENAPLIILITGGENAGEIWTQYRRLTEKACLLAAVPVVKWEDELSPWAAPAVFRGAEDFGAGADKTADELEKSIVPAVCRAAELPGGSPIYIAGYSLAGLFALYALYRTGIFAGAVSASGSLWFPGFEEFTEHNEPVKKPEKIYFSLGDREKNTKNPVMKSVEEKTKSICGRFADRGTECVFRLNPGGHFRDAEKRLAEGMAWIV